MLKKYYLGAILLLCGAIACDTTSTGTSTHSTNPVDSTVITALDQQTTTTPTMNNETYRMSISTAGPSEENYQRSAEWWRAATAQYDKTILHKVLVTGSYQIVLYVSEEATKPYNKTIQALQQNLKDMIPFTENFSTIFTEKVYQEEDPSYQNKTVAYWSFEPALKEAEEAFEKM